MTAGWLATAGITAIAWAAVLTLTSPDGNAPRRVAAATLARAGMVLCVIGGGVWLAERFG